MAPETMRAFQITGRNQAGIYDVPIPQLRGPSSILIRNEAATLCNMTDVHIYEGTHEPNGPDGWDTPLPFTLGHESAGVVVRKGAGVTEVDIGDRVALSGFFESGSFAEYTVASQNYAKVDMSGEQGALVEMLSCVYLIVEQVFTVGESVALLGCGAAGTLALKLVVAGGATKVIVADPHPGKRQYALANGASHVIEGTRPTVSTRRSR